MNEKTLHTLEYDKVLGRLAAHSAFGASQEMALALRPSDDIEEARRRLAETGEARLLLSTQPETSVGGARDVRQAAESAKRGAVLTASDLLDIKETLISARTLGRLFERGEETYPRLTALAANFPPPLGLVDAISRTLSERGEVLDSASDKLGGIRRELHVVHDRLLSRMQRMVSNAKITPYLQDALVTQRDGRYVLPVRADAKGRVKGVVHDQSSSGATLFIEPLAVVESNNQWRELQLAERDEERRILAALCGQVGEHAGDIQQAVETLGALDLAFACAKYAEELKASEPALHGFKPDKDGKHPGVRLRLWQARHPLLDPATVVPIDLELDPQTFMLVITGPNTGGKTVTLKTAGLLALMAQAGLHIPAQAGSEISVFKAVFADIGDEQSIEQSLSTFSGHITNIIHILDKADGDSLVIIDELGAGTDPQEGAALARAILGFLVERGVTTLVATHYPELKAYAHGMPGVTNASVEFDLETLRPTYHLTVGLPGRSNALAIAKRLGLQDEIVEAARATIDPDELRAEDLLGEIHRQRDLARQARAEAETSRQEAHAAKTELVERLEKIEDERLEVLSAAREAVEAEVQTLEDEIRKTRAELARARQPLEAVEQAAERAADIKAEVQAAEARRPVPEAAASRALRLGDRVKVRALNKEGVISALGREDAEVQV
ncbi:MAG: endonuclease MutS2, partial [Anaerolineae bacterium]|nr:endonuclease MutS2 [Anaerolineae bacterium]